MAGIAGWLAALSPTGWAAIAIAATAGLAVVTAGVIAWRTGDRLPGRSWPVRVWYALTFGVPPREDDQRD